MTGFWQTPAQVWRASPSKPIRATAKYLLRSAFSPQVTLAWQQAAAENPVLAQFISQKPRMLLKLQRPYLNRGYCARQRLDALVEHYQFIRRLPSDLTRDLVDAHGRGVAHFSAAAGNAYTLRLCGTDRFDREGELLLSLELDGARQRVACVAFTITGDNPQTRRLEVGCLQGGDAQTGREIIKRATKDFHGLRPKNVVMDAAYALATCWNIHRIVAVGNTMRIYDNDGRNKLVFADYDSFWNELGGTASRDGVFVLPRNPRHRPPGEVPSSRRAEYRRRMELREGLAEQIHVRLKLSPHQEVRLLSPPTQTVGRERWLGAFAG